jgi:aminoglycoside phosphotransferase (APT) family kinase protein
MTISYSAVKSIAAPETMAALLADQVFRPVLPSVTVRRVRTRPGRRLEAPRVLWNVYEAELEMPGGIEVRPLFWTKVYFDDEEALAYRNRVERWLSAGNTNPLNPGGYARHFPEHNLFLLFFPTDPVFPRLANVITPASVYPLLADHFAHLRPDTKVRGLQATRVKYFPEICCIVRYDADVGEEEPLTIYGKVQHSNRGARTYEAMQALWGLPARADGNLLIAQPLAYHAKEALLLQSALPGDEVKGDRHSEVFMAQCVAAGRVIGHIHASGIELGQPHHVRLEIDRIQKRLDEIKLSAPSAYLLLRGLLVQIAARVEKLRPESKVPSHGDYKYNQFLHSANRFGLIDVEYFAQAEPSFDLGKYCGHLWPASPNDWSDTAQTRKARQLFLEAYLTVRPEYDGRRFALYEALSLATRALVVTWAQSRNAPYLAETLAALAYEQLKTPWGE